MMHKAWCSVEEVHYCFSRSSIKIQGHTGWKMDDLNPVCLRIDIMSTPSEINFSFDCHRTSLMISQHWSRWWLVLLGNKPLPKPMLTQICDTPQSVVTLPQLGGLCASKTPEALPAGVLLLVGFTMLDRLWGRGQTKCNTEATDAGNISAWTELVDDPVMRCPSQSPDWTSHGPTTRNAWVCVLCHLSCGYPLPCDAESLACHADG